MTIDALIMLSGAFVAFLPFLGFPHRWDAVLFFLAGVFVVALGIVVRRQRSHHASEGTKSADSYEESAPPHVSSQDDR